LGRFSFLIAIFILQIVFYGSYPKGSAGYTYDYQFAFTAQSKNETN
jgi:hypothetical protein